MHDDLQVGVPIIGISRLRLGTDGAGVTTLVAFHECILRCKYCINPESFGSPIQYPLYTPQKLLDQLMPDDVYFCAIDGGVTFGGGEPGLHTDFIRAFKKICPSEWKIRLETALQFHYQNTELLAPIVDEWIVDVKTAEFKSYYDYTGGDYQQVVKNLHYLVDEFHVDKDKFLIRIPIIPGYTTSEQVEATQKRFRDQGFTRFDVFEYVTKRPDSASHDGKSRCEVLKQLRREIADNLHLDLKQPECHHEGDCSGACPLCDAELLRLSESVRASKMRQFTISDDVRHSINTYCGGGENPQEKSVELAGMPKPIEEPCRPLDGLIIPPPNRRPPVKEVLFKECAIAGVSFHLKADDELWEELFEGQPLVLVRESDNKYDHNAVAVALLGDYCADSDDFDFSILGYLPRSENEMIAKLLDMGWSESLHARLSTVKREGSLNERLRVSIFLLENEKAQLKLLRTVSLSPTEYQAMRSELEERGTVHFRWGGNLARKYNMPKVGEQVMVVYRRDDECLMFLMRILAKGDKCFPYLDRTDDITAIDDAVCYVLTNICGPLYFNHEELEDMNMNSVCAHTINETLTEDESIIFRGIFTDRFCHPADFELEPIPPGK
jgi:pyruvate formate lyase activating enzyme